VVRAATAGELTSRGRPHTDSGVRFELATPEHDAPLRRLLRENPMPGSISLSLEREPSFFAAAGLEGLEHQTIVALQGDRVVAAGSISARQRFINGQPMRVGYLGALRLDTSCSGHALILRRGYDAFRRLHDQGGPRIYLTSIIADNLPARKFLGRNLRGMPTYRFLGEFVTLIIRRHHRLDLFQPLSRARRRLREQGIELVHGSDERSAEILELLNRDHQKYQFAPVWSASELHPDTFQIALAADGRPVACAALSDQRTIKQIVVRGYSGHLRWARPLINLGATFLGRPRLPRIRMPLSHAFISHLAVSSDQPQLAECLVNLLCAHAPTRGIDYLILGFDSRDSRLAHLRRVLRPREYISRIYVVHWEDGVALAQSLDDRLLAPEVASL
jgi:hypothetical protein